MTEITVNNAGPLWPESAGPFYVVDPVAFALAFVGAPVLSTMATFFFLIPIGALMVGGPVYIVIGLPVLLWHLRHHPPDTGRIAYLSIQSNVAVMATILLWCVVSEKSTLVGLAWFYLIVGSLFAGIWGAVFSWLYQRLQRDVYRQPVPPYCMERS